MKKYLVPTDFSTHAENALHFAILMAQKQNAEIILLHVIPLPLPVAQEPYNVMQLEMEQLRKDAKKDLQSECIHIDHAGGIKYESRIAEGQAVDEIIKTAKKDAVDMIIMGTRGAGSFEGAIFGSTASHVIRQAEQPVLAIPEEAVFDKEIKKITYATGYQKNDVQKIKHLADLAAAFRAQLNVLHISEEKIEAEEEVRLMADFMKQVNKEISYNNLSFQILHGKSPEEQIEKYIDEDSTDLLVVSTGYRTFFERIFKKSLTRHLVQKTTIPVLAYHFNSKAEIKIFS